MVLIRHALGATLLTVIASAVPAFSQAPSAKSVAALPVSAISSTASSSAILSGGEDAWDATSEVELHLNHTPPLYDTDPRDDGYRPKASMRLIRQDSLLYVRLTWTDSTVDSIPAAKRYADAGEPAVYKRQSEVIDQFRDAACIMTPRGGAAGANPSLVMGDIGLPVTLYYWRNGEGFAVGEAAGRGSTTMSTTSFPGHATHQASQWEVIFALPMSTASMPIALAIWDGSRDQRDGLKYYSLWYEVQE